MNSQKREHQPLLPTFIPSENDMIEAALRMPFDKKVDKCVEFWKTYGERGQINVRDSGGKDSCALVFTSDLSGIDTYKTYSDTTIDPPMLQEFLKEHHPDTEWINAGRGHLILDRAVEKRNLPTRRGKWCCGEYKNCCNGKSCDINQKAVGVRISESSRRAKAWSLTTTMKTGEVILAPLAYWTDDDIWRLIKENNVPYCEMYDQGWTRLGCVGCPINPKSQKREFEVFPEYASMWKSATEQIWTISQNEKNTRGEWRYWTKFDSPDEMWLWWINGGHNKSDTNCIFEDMMEGLM